MTVQSTSAHAIDVLIPSAAGLGGAYVTLTSGNAKYFGTLFVDSQDTIPTLNGCTYQLSPSSNTVSNAGGALPILVVTQAGCAYSVQAFDGFVTAGSGGTGTGIVSPTFAANAGAARTATIEIAGQPLTLTQNPVGPS